MTECINEAFDFASVDMFQAGEGWLREIRYIDWPANSRTLPIPPDVAIINNIRWLNGDTYYPLKYDVADATIQTAVGAAGAEPTAYRIVQNKIYLNPAPSSSGARKIELEFSRYPTRLLSGQQNIMPDFDNSVCHWLKYYVAMTLMPPGSSNPKYKENEAIWFGQMQKIISLRNRVKKVIQDFGTD